MLIKPGCLHFLTATRVNMGAGNVQSLCRSISCIVLTLLVFRSCYAEKTEFDVVPGGQEWSMEKSLGDVTCKFTYKCQGGTKEKWEMDVFPERDNYVCQVSRPDGKSYLFFQEFKVEVVGASIIGAELANNNGNIGADQYKVENKKVSPTSKFDAGLIAIRVTMTTGKGEL